MKAVKTSGQEDYPLSEVPVEARKSLLSTSVVLLGFTFFTAKRGNSGRIQVAAWFL